MSKWTWFVGVLVACAAVPRAAHAYELKQTSTGAFERWDGASVTFVIDPSVEQAAPGAVKAVESALTAWSGQGGAPLLSAQVGPGGGKVANDGQNTILYAPDGYAPAGDALAVTISTVEDESGTLIDTDIVINGPYAFAVLAASAHGSSTGGVSTDGAGPEQLAGGSFDLEHVVSHEIGHALGLADVHDAHAVMYAFTAPGDASNRAPSSDDMQGLDSLYGGPLKRAGCGQATIGGRAPGAAWPIVAALGVLVAVAARRRREEPARYDAPPSRVVRSARTTLPAMAAHDLRTPLTAMSVNLEFVRDAIDADASPEVRAALEDCRAAAGRAERIVADMTEIARLRAGTVLTDLVEVDAAEMLARLVRDLSVAPGSRIVRLAGPREPRYAAADPSLLERACARVLECAVTHARHGGTVEAALEGRDIVVRTQCAGVSAVDVADRARGSLAACFAEAALGAMGGGLTVEGDTTGAAIVFRLVLPG